MADNVTLPGTGAVVASDDVGGVQYQYVKIAYGADGVATIVDTSTGVPIQPGATATPADARSNTGATNLNVGAHLLVYNGTTWDRVRNVTAVDGGGSTGVQAAGMIGFDSTAAVNRRVRADAVGTLYTRPFGTSTCTVSSVTAAASSTSLLAARTTRAMATFYNDSTADLYLKLGATASTTSFTIKIAGGGYYELPVAGGVYTGAIDGIWSSATGAVRITEVG